MKKCILLISIYLFSLSYLIGQQTPSKLDSIFMQLDTADMSTGILYDKTFRFGKADTFNIINDTAISMHNFRQILLDMKVGSVNLNNSIITLDSLRNMVNADAINNIVPITILNYKYNILKEYALDSNLIYLNNEQLYDVTTRTENPYYEKHVFMACPALPAEMDSSVVFSVSAASPAASGDAAELRFSKS